MRASFIAVLALLTASGIVPVAASADDSSASVPGPFVGAPTILGSQGGEFTVNFDGRLRFEGVGRAPDPIDVFPGSFDSSIRSRFRHGIGAAFLDTRGNRFLLLDVRRRILATQAAVLQITSLEAQLRGMSPALPSPDSVSSSR